MALAIAMLVLAVFILVPPEPPDQGPVRISYTQFKSFLREGHVEQISIRGDEIEGRLGAVVPGAERAAEQGFRSYVPEFGDPELLPLIEERGVEFNVAPRQETGLMALLAALLPWVIIIGVWIYIMRRMMGGGIGGRMGGFGGGRDVTDYLSGSSKEEEKAGKRVTFADVAGQDAAVRCLLTEAEQRAETVLTSHRAAVERLIASLEHNETLDRASIEQYLASKERAQQENSVTTTAA